MARHRHVDAFDERAATTDAGRPRGMRPLVVARTVELAMHLVPAPRRILDVRCGTGDLLRLLAAASPTAVALVGVDPQPAAIDAARAAGEDDRLRFDVGTADTLRYADGTFDLVVSTAPFDRWSDQPAGLAQCARVLAPGGQLVVTGRFPAVLTPMLLGRRARTRRRAEALLARQGFGPVQWHEVVGRRVRAVAATASRGDWPLSA